MEKYDRLYLIGNGFDLHHDMKTKYSDYADWLHANYSDLYWCLFRVYDINVDDLWRTFEESLAAIPPESIWGSNVSIPYVAMTGGMIKSLSGNEMVSPEIGRSLDDMFEDIKNTFHEWVRQIDSPNKLKAINLERNDAFFINFNYTDTLEAVYGINARHILYIHGNAQRSEDIVIGHHITQCELNQIYTTEGLDEDQAADVLVARKQISSMYKNIDMIINRQRECFNHLQNVREVYVYGLSCSKVDMPYLEYLCDKLELRNVRWCFSYYNNKNEIIATASNLGLSNVKYVQLEDLVRSTPIQLSLFDRL